MNIPKREVYELQHMLRKISLSTGELPLVNTDGIYDDTTREAVSAFQNQASLPVTSEVDRATWDKIFEKYKKCMYMTSGGDPIYPFPSVDYVANSEEQTDFVMIMQVILSALSLVYDDFEDVKITGVYDNTTKNAVKRFQAYHKLEPNGILDKNTWNTAARSFNTHFSHRHYAS